MNNNSYDFESYRLLRVFENLFYNHSTLLLIRLNASRAPKGPLPVIGVAAIPWLEPPHC